jgi:SAM-dependent methyltransferase
MMPQAVAPYVPEPRCAACGAHTLVAGERIATRDLIAAWRREDVATGALDIIDPRAAAISSSLPPEVRFERCTACGLEMAVPATVWSSAAYPRDQSYPIRWEFGRGVEDLGAAPKDVLEIGCGEGHFLAMAAARGHRAVGIDFSDTAVAKAQARGLRAFCGGFDELARHVGRAARFDGVALFQVIEHLADPDALFAALAEWTRPGARLLISCPGPRRFTRLIREHQAGASDFWDYPPHHVLRWTLPALRAVVARHGWVITEAMEEPFSWVAAGSHIGIARAIHHGQLDRPLGRRMSIAAAWLRLLLTPGARAGMSLYVCAVRETRR